MTELRLGLQPQTLSLCLRTDYASAFGLGHRPFCLLIGYASAISLRLIHLPLSPQAMTHLTTRYE
jgi:hypothetical protein